MTDTSDDDIVGLEVPPQADDDVDVAEEGAIGGDNFAAEDDDAPRPPRIQPPPERLRSKLIGNVNAYRHIHDEGRPLAFLKALTDGDTRYNAHPDWVLDQDLCHVRTADYYADDDA